MVHKVEANFIFSILKKKKKFDFGALEAISKSTPTYLLKISHFTLFFPFLVHCAVLLSCDNSIHPQGVKCASIMNAGIVCQCCFSCQSLTNWSMCRKMWK